MVTLLDISEIKKIIPHRYPFLLLDKVLELNPHKNIVALKNITINEDFFNGHFPKKPVMPGVLIIEAMAQAGAVFASKSIRNSNGPNENQIIYFTSIEKAHFRKPVEPGDTLHILVKQKKARSNIWKMSGEAKVNNMKVADAIFSAMVIKE